MRKLYILGIIALAAIIIGLAWAEQITFTTYYPAPYGRYREFSTSGKTTLATDEYGIETDAMVGIGTTDPSGILHVAGGNAESGKDGRDIILQAESAPEGTSLNYNGGNIILLPGKKSGEGADGNVGIGTTSPAVPLHVYGSGTQRIHVESSDGAAWFRANVPSGNNSGILMQEAASNKGLIYWDGTNDILRFQTPNNGFVVDTSGNVGIGTTSPGAKLHVGGTAGTDGIMFPDGTLQTTAGGGGAFGSWASRSEDDIHTAATDGIVIAYNTVIDKVIYGYTPSGTLRLRVGKTSNWGTPGALIMPVRKDDTWRVTCTGTLAALWWLPIGD